MRSTPLITFLLLFLVAASSAPALTVAPALVEAASNLSGYPVPPRPIPIAYVSQDWLNLRVCPTVSCGVDGIVGGTVLDGVIYVLGSLSREDRDAITVHEVVHVMQAASLKPMTRCAKEYEAGKVDWSYRVLYQQSTEDFAVNWRFYRCA